MCKKMYNFSAVSIAFDGGVVTIPCDTLLKPRLRVWYCNLLDPSKSLSGETKGVQKRMLILFPRHFISFGGSLSSPRSVSSQIR